MPRVIEFGLAAGLFLLTVGIILLFTTDWLLENPRWARYESIIRTVNCYSFIGLIAVTFLLYLFSITHQSPSDFTPPERKAPAGYHEKLCELTVKDPDGHIKKFTVGCDEINLTPDQDMEPLELTWDERY